MSDKSHGAASRPLNSDAPDHVAARIRDAREQLTVLLDEARAARERRAEVAGADSSGVCAWNHFENIPTFFNWNNRPH